VSGPRQAGWGYAYTPVNDGRFGTGKDVEAAEGAVVAEDWIDGLCGGG
jgi:hypothetical protein